MKKKICNTEEIFDKVMGLEKEPPARQEVLKELAELDKNFKKYGFKPKMIEIKKLSKLSLSTNVS